MAADVDPQLELVSILLHIFISKAATIDFEPFWAISRPSACIDCTPLQNAGCRDLISKSGEQSL